MEIFTTVANHPIAAVSIITLIIAFFKQKYRQYLLLGLSRIAFVPMRRSYLHKSLGDAFITYLQRNGYGVKRYSGELYGEDPAFIRSEQEVKHILYKDVNSNTQFFYHKAGLWVKNTVSGKREFHWPIIVSGQPLVQAKDTVKHYSYIVYTPRWSKKYIQLLDAATEMKNDKDDAPELSRFVVKKVSGLGGKAHFAVEKQRNLNGETADKPTVVTEDLLADPFSTYIPVKWDKENIGQLVYHNSLDMMSLNPELESVLEEIKFWLDHQEWYEERGIPWKRGFLFYGRPGTGKTMFTRALAEHLNLPLLIFDLASMDSTEFSHAWSQLLPRRIALFEDFDAVFNKRTNIMQSGLDFSTILNALDGADKKQGILTIITTNHPEKLDFALGGPIDGDIKKTKDGKFVIIDKESQKIVNVYETVEEAEQALKFNGGKLPSRPGRIDRSVEFVPLDRAGRLKLALRIMKDEAAAEKMVELGVNDSAAQLQERCFRAAIDLLFNAKKPLAKDAKPAPSPINA